ncbi:MAG: hypothetical protein WBQ75_07250 [Acetobacteraceae bacterium]
MREEITHQVARIEGHVLQVQVMTELVAHQSGGVHLRGIGLLHQDVAGQLRAAVIGSAHRGFVEPAVIDRIHEERIHDRRRIGRQINQCVQIAQAADDQQLRGNDRLRRKKLDVDGRAIEARL